MHNELAGSRIAWAYVQRATHGIRARRSILSQPRSTEKEKRAQQQREAQATNKKLAKERADRVSRANAYAVEYIFTPERFYDRLAAQLIETAAGQRSQKKGHWLCIQLKETITSINPATWASAAEKPTVSALQKVGFRPVVANGLGAGAALGIRVAFSRTPLADIITSLRVLISLVCPNLNECPARSEALIAYLSPTLSRELHDLERASEVRAQSS
ncbi:hypothetical protein [Actinomycetospora sp. NBC_00405]|uniref:hypothetical protein n=1 Tax=Actinomycetospora sp. NBC_00405 TaxID=2975952 RepID=UPI002E1E602E